MVTENLNQVRENIKAACEAAGRDPKSNVDRSQQDEAGSYASGSI